MDPFVAHGRLIALLEIIAFNERACRLCATALYLIHTRLGTSVFTGGGVDHTQNCPHCEPKASQDALFPPGVTRALDPS